MRSLKKILALALVFAMAFTFTAGAAVDFTDKAEIGASYLDDVNMLVELGVIAGYPDGSFGPAKNITRAEFAKMAYTIKYGSDTDGNLFAAQKSAFSDVEGNANVAWAKGYINYCANQNIVSGVGAGKFNPQGNITVAEATKMLLVILGCDPAKEGFTGANWMANVVSKAIDLGIYNGWTGDPSQLATRELVAKLMRNTIFSSVYTYSAITGAGSQKDALGQNWNDTLGETTMGLKTVTGIVVANERYALLTDAEGNTLNKVASVDAAVNDGDYVSSKAIRATGAESGEAVILYETSNKDNDYYLATLTIDRALADEMLGNKVNVFFKADRIENNGRFDYKNVEVIGDVLVHSDTVAYTVSSLATDVYPNGTSSSAALVQPYIGFTVGDEEFTIETSLADGVAKSEKKVDYQAVQNNTAFDNLINKYAYILDSETMSAEGALRKATTNEFYKDMGVINAGQKKAVVNLDTYRFISVDGGNSYSYMIKVHTDAANSNITFAAVTAYNPDRGTIRISGLGTLDIADIVLVDEVAVDDYVVAYRENGTVYVEKVDTITGAVESFGDDGSVVINGTPYWAWSSCKLDDTTLFAHYNTNKAAMGASTQYYVYGNLIMEINADAEAAAVENYAVILRSWLDEEMGTAYVTLGFADGTEGSYQIGKLYTKNAAKPNDASNDLATDFANNAMFGLVVSYKIRDNGTLDLSSQYFKETTASKRTLKVLDYGKNDNVTVVTKKAFNIASTDNTVNGKDMYALNDATVVFALYGNPAYNAGKVDSTTAKDYCLTHGHQCGTCGCDATCDIVGFTPVKAKAYKLGELESLTANQIPSLNVNSAAAGTVGSIVVNSATATTKYIVAAAITVGADVTMAGASYKDTKDYAYVVSAKQIYNLATDLSYAELTVINKEGVKTLTTVEGITDFNSQELFSQNMTQKLDGKNGSPNWVAGFVKYETNADGVVTMLDVTPKSAVQTAYGNINWGAGVQDGGFLLVTVVGERNGILSFYDATEVTSNLTTDTSVVLQSREYHEDGYAIIGIDEEDFAEDYLTTISNREEVLTANKGNAILQISEGQIKTVFSFTEGYSK